MKSNTILLFALFCFGLNSWAQTRKTEKIENKNGELRIVIEEESKGHKKIFEKSYATKGMSEEQKEALIERVRDSLATANEKTGANNFKKKKENAKIDLDDDLDIDIKISPEGDKQSRIYKFKGNKNGEPFEQQIERFAEDFGRDMERFGKRLERQFDKNNFRFEYIDGDDSLKTKNRKNKNKSFYLNLNEGSNTIEALKAYPNNPFNNTLNIRFYAPQKGDIIISIADVNGKQVGLEKIQGFSGAYIGQVALKSAEKGTLFVTVTQGKDGQTKRVVID